MIVNPKEVQSYFQNNKKELKQIVKQLKKLKPKQLDPIAAMYHEEAFEEIDCLDCANCCRTLGPRLTEKDIERMAKTLKMKSSQVFDAYIKTDDDSDYVFKSMPCPFLMDDNCCLIYHQHPKACREYPHTNRKKFLQLLDLTYKNAAYCPAAIYVLLKLNDYFF